MRPGGSNPSLSAGVDRQFREGAGVVERGRLLSGCGLKRSTEGSNPSLPATNPRKPGEYSPGFSRCNERRCRISRNELNMSIAMDERVESAIKQKVWAVVGASNDRNK